MARPKDPNPELKRRLAKAALALVKKEGPEELSVRAVAERAGVSANAPFLYYPDGARELHAAVAIAGFTELRAELGRPFEGASVAWARELVIRYVRFGVENANLYRAMFHGRLAEPLESRTPMEKGEATYASLRELKLETYEDLVAPLLALRSERSLRGDAVPREAPGLAFAALAHGLVGEFIDEGLLRPDDDSAPWTSRRLAMTVAVADALLFGLLASAGDVSAVGAAAGQRLSDEDESWARYAETVLEFFPGAKPITIDLRRPLSDAGERLRERGLPDSFAVITACNPRGRTVGDAENEARSEELKRLVRLDGQIWLPVTGMSPNRRHREPGIAVAMPQSQAERIAREFEQSAFYWYDGTAFWLLGALVAHAPVRLPVRD